MDDALKTIADVFFKHDDFEMAKEFLLRRAKDLNMKMYYYAEEETSVLLYEGLCSREDCLKALQSVTKQNFAVYLDNLRRDGFHYTFLVNGNIGSKRASVLCKKFTDNMGVPLLSKAESTMADADVTRTIQIPKPTLLTISNPIRDDRFSVVNIRKQLDGVPTIAQQVHIDLLNIMISEHAFDYLRTESGLGYSVGASFRGGYKDLFIYVQSDKFAPEYIDEKISNWLTKFKEYVVKLEQDKFEEVKAGAGVRLKELAKELEKDKTSLSLKDETKLYWRLLVQKYDTCSDRRIIDLKFKYLEGMKSKNPMIETLDAFLDSKHIIKTFVRSDKRDATRENESRHGLVLTSSSRSEFSKYKQAFSGGELKFLPSPPNYCNVNHEDASHR